MLTMVFELSEELINQIIFAMENQQGSFVLDTVESVLVEYTPEKALDTSHYFKLPEWDSTNGFRMMERFVTLQHNPVLKRELRSVLFSGKGVFRNFKNVLKSFPEVEKQWFLFKDREMKQYIIQWYNTLRESWGLEKLGAEPEEHEDLVHDDFVLRKYQEDKDEEHLVLAANAIMAERESAWPGEIGIALSDLWQRRCSIRKSHDSFSLVAETVDGDFAGCISASPCPSYARKTMLLTTFFVVQTYRGLGIGKELLSMCLSGLQSRGIRWVILADTVIPGFLEPCLIRNGFVSCGGGYIADLIAGQK